VAGFSSNGPTNDNRIKPEVVTPGVSVFSASKNADTTYARNNGTSLATPLAAGVAALVRSARPDLTPMKVRDALRFTADKASAPNNSHGWGKVDAWEALLYNGMVISTNPKVLWNGATNTIAFYVLSRSSVSNSRVKVTYSVDGGAPVDRYAKAYFEQYPGLSSGSGLYMISLGTLPKDALVRYYISAEDAKEGRTSPFNAPVNRHQFRVGETHIVGGRNLIPSEYRLDQSYPNPIVARQGAAFSFRYDVPEPGGRVTIEMFDVAGRRLAVLLDEEQSPGIHVLPPYDPGALDSGAYFYTLRAADRLLTRRMVVLQ
jgi:hypothetical protein